MSKAANLVSISRIPMAAAFVIVFEIDALGLTTILLVLTVLIEVSDAIDGPIARRLSATSEPGAILDTLADSMARGPQFVCLLSIGAIPLWVVVVFLVRDGAISAIRMISLSESAHYISRRESGRWKGITQGLCLVTLVASLAFYGMTLPDWLSTWRWVTIYFAVSVAALSGIDYSLHNRRVLVQLVWGK